MTERHMPSHDNEMLSASRRGTINIRIVHNMRVTTVSSMALTVVAMTSMLIVLDGCVTPPETKQALTSLDQSYAANAKLMQQYRELMTALNIREAYWHHYVLSRAKLHLALQWATTNPLNHLGTESHDAVDLAVQILGDDVVKIVNQVRLSELPARKDTHAVVKFTPGTAKMEQLLPRIPTLVTAIVSNVDAEWKKVASPDYMAYDAYETNVAVMRRLNAAVKQYLDIDVTINPTDVSEIAAAAKKFR